MFRVFLLAATCVVVGILPFYDENVKTPQSILTCTSGETGEGLLVYK